MANPKVVILMLENRSFDEFFGTFPGAIGFYDTSANAAAFTQKGFTNNPSGAVQDLPPLQPFRASSFSTTNASGEEYGVFWNPQHLAWNYGAMNGWSIMDKPSISDHTAMSYAAANDIPYFWTLAQNFLLCDTYFCSILGSTFPNRIMFMSGTIFDPSTLTGTNPVVQWQFPANVPVIDNVTGNDTINTWPSYPNIIGAALPWTIYDDQGWQPNWIAWTNPEPTSSQVLPSYIAAEAIVSGATLSSGWPGSTWVGGLSVLDYLDAGGTTLGHTTDTTPFPSKFNLAGSFYSATPTTPPTLPLPATDAPPGPGDDQSNFENDARDGKLPDISWIVPPPFCTAHPDWLPADAECYLARMVNAVVNSPHWDNEGVVFIITFDENDGQFDHVRPPTSMSDLLQAYGTGGTIAPLQTPILGGAAAPPMLAQPALPAFPTPPLPPPAPWEPWVNGLGVRDGRRPVLRDRARGRGFPGPDHHRVALDLQRRKANPQCVIPGAARHAVRPYLHHPIPRRCHRSAYRQ